MKKIFIADDDLDILTITSLMLQRSGYLVQATTNANDIFEISAGNADVIILDLWMSGIDGRDIYTKLRQNEKTKEIPILFMSANSQLKDIAAEYEVTDYIEKPFEMNHLLSKVHNALLGKKQDMPK